jgi:alkanesulfonate monooxygenase
MPESLSLSDSLEIFSTCPQSKDLTQESYLRRVIEVARWSEEAGCTGILVYTDNGLVDPWLVAQVILQNTERLCPLVAVQPVYMSPYAVAKLVASYGFLYNRRVYLNMVAGGFKNDLHALNDTAPHDDRYLRLTEYTLIIRRLLESSDPVAFEGKYYTVRNLRMTPALPPELIPGFLMSGSSPAGTAAALAAGATAIVYPGPVETEVASQPSLPRRGGRVGIIAHVDGEEAWRTALKRFPPDRKGQLTHKLAMAVTDSQWHKQLSDLDECRQSLDKPYWLWPFQNYHTFCPYLVGTYDRIAEEVARYIAKGYDTFIVDVPHAQADLESAGIVFQMAMARARSSGRPMENGRPAQNVEAPGPGI